MKIDFRSGAPCRRVTDWSSTDRRLTAIVIQSRQSVVGPTRLSPSMPIVRQNGEHPTPFRNFHPSIRFFQYTGIHWRLLACFDDCAPPVRGGQATERRACGAVFKCPCMRNSSCLVDSRRGEDLPRQGMQARLQTPLSKDAHSRHSSCGDRLAGFRETILRSHCGSQYRPTKLPERGWERSVPSVSSLRTAVPTRPYKEHARIALWGQDGCLPFCSSSAYTKVLAGLVVYVVSGIEPHDTVAVVGWLSFPLDRPTHRR